MRVHGPVGVMTPYYTFSRSVLIAGRRLHDRRHLHVRPFHDSRTVAVARIELSIYIAAPRQRCFDLARSVEAHMHTTSSSGERAVGGKTSGLLGEGDQV